jgi:hypothetical protein
MDYTVELAENTELLAFDGTIRKIESLAVGNRPGLTTKTGSFHSKTTWAVI